MSEHPTITRLREQIRAEVERDLRTRIAADLRESCAQPAPGTACIIVFEPGSKEAAALEAYNAGVLDAADRILGVERIGRLKSIIGYESRP